MGTRPPSKIPWPISSFPGATPQESSGRLVNCYAEPLGDPQKPTGPAGQVWRRAPGMSLFAQSQGLSGYRGGLIVNNLAYEAWAGQMTTVTSAGVVTLRGAANSFSGTKKISIARNQASSPDVIAVDPDNGAFLLTSSGVPSAPTSFNGGGNLPQPNSICFQDGYFFFTIGNCQVFATALNSTTVNALTFITAQSKSDVTLLRGIPFSGLLFLFTTGGLEVWQDAGNAAPNFPYNRLVILPYGLIQGAAIAGFETGFDDLMWVAQDLGVYRLQWGSLQPQKISPPDLDRLIEKQVNAGGLLEASVYMFAGQKRWVLSCPGGTWEFNLNTQRWNERMSLNQATGQFTRWRATGGHPAFGKWLMGDTQSGNLLYLDDTNYTENGAVQLFRMESGPVNDFPDQIRIARADFDFVMGQGIVQGNILMSVQGAAAGNNGVVRLTVNNTAQVNTGDIGVISGIVGTTEANGTFPLTVIDATHVEIPVQFQNAYTSGGTVVDQTATPNQINPQAAISLSKDGGSTYSNPRVRAVGQQGKVKRQRASVKNMGQSGAIGDRWRVDVSDPVYVALLGATQSSDPREWG